MNLSQKQTILNVIESFEKTDFESAFAQKYKDTATIDSVSASDYSVAELLALSRKSVEQMKTLAKHYSNNRVSAFLDWSILAIGNC